MSQRCLNLCGLSVAFWVGCGGPSDPARREGVVSDSGFDDADDDSGTDTDTGDASSVEGEWTFGVDTVQVSATVNAGRRTYTMSSTHPQRDGGPSQRTFSERDGDPLLRSGVLLTDAVFALAVEEARQNAVSVLSDGAFTEPVSCECFQTGELWNWVWTRDIAYATELGLAWLDPERAANSLLFKTSRPKEGGALELVQDTGTGGSWPISTDRVTWARGAMAVLSYVDHPELRAAAVEAMAAAAARDRRYVWDATDGLYRGETSFLDWREQSYPRWTSDDVVHIGTSKSLSTNLNHLFLLRSLESLTGEAHGSADLAAAIDRVFWRDDHYASFVMSGLAETPAARRDLLATSLAVRDLGTHPEALESYPFGSFGPPVFWPQQQLTPIYHNRATWPFVTAYGVLAARDANNGAVFDAGLDALIRGAALNLSHMENFEVTTGANWVEDGIYSGPVVNSRRQLWSVAGFLGAIANGVFGMRGDGDGGLIFDPIRPSAWFGSSASFSFRGQNAALSEERLAAGQRMELSTEDWRDFYAAREPDVVVTGQGSAVSVFLTGEEEAVFDLWRDGARVASDVSGEWSDTATSTACYVGVARLRYPSLPSAPQCWWGDDFVRVQSIAAAGFEAVGGQWSTQHGRGHYESWGGPDDTLSLEFSPQFTGRHLLQAVFSNGAAGVDTGVTAGVKWLSVWDGDALVGEGALVLPHTGGWSQWRDSGVVAVSLSAGRSYTVRVVDGWNMSFLEHYRNYSGPGGGAGSSNFVNIAEIKVLYRPELDR